MSTSSRISAESRSLRESPITHQLVLVGCDSCEDRLNEHEGAELLRFEIEQGSSVVLLLYDVDPRLVFVHGIEDDLQRMRRARISLQWNVQQLMMMMMMMWKLTECIEIEFRYLISLHHKEAIHYVNTKIQTNPQNLYLCAAENSPQCWSNISPKLQ